MKYLNRTRANRFDQLVGELQTLRAVELGVGDSILDIGCGVGQFTPFFLYKFKKVVGLDPSEKYLREARRQGWKVEYVEGWGETYEGKFDTINMTNLLEHVDNPVKLLENCKRNLNEGGRIIAQVPNSNSMARRLGVNMGIIDSIENISEKERNYWGHQRVYTPMSLAMDFANAGLEIVEQGGILYKPLPNEFLDDLCTSRGKKWENKFVKALVDLGKDRPDECAQLYICAK